MENNKVHFSMDQEEYKNHIITEYQSNCRYEASPLCVGIPDDLDSSFWNWFKKNSYFLPASDVIWENVPQKDHEFKIRRCHYNSITNSIRHGYELYCGLAIKKTKNLPLEIESYTSHSINTVDKGIYDFTYFFNKKHPDLTSVNIPCNYLALKIPDAFLKQIKDRIDKMNESGKLFGINRPLASYYFLYNEFNNDDLNSIIEEISSN